jgi:hypothetical protein
MKVVTFLDSHFTVAAVEMKSKSLSVIEQEQTSVLLASVMFRTDTQFIPDTISCTHQFGFIIVQEFICGLDGFSPAVLIYGLR